MFNKIQTNAVIATGFGGDAAFKNALADIGADADAAVGHFDNQLPGVELDQDFHRLMRQLGTLRGFDGVIQQVADDGDQFGFHQRRQGAVDAAGRVEAQRHAFFAGAGGFAEQQTA